MRQSWRLQALLMIVVALLFLYQCWDLWFVQDDSFITFRYVRNFIAGRGLVFNAGERVEGYTTFLWTLMLALPARLGIDMVRASQFLGIFFGLGSLWLLFVLTRNHSGREGRFPLSLAAPALLAANGAFAYWSVSGMETAMFTFLTILSTIVYLEERKKESLSVYTPLAFVLLSLTRPEGVLLFGLSMFTLLWEIRSSTGNDRKRMIKRLIVWSAIYLAPMSVVALWRLSYYGYILPNTFYAKAGFSKEYLLTGAEYFWTFTKTYLLGGALLLAPIYAMIRRKWTGDALVLFTLLLGYVVYVIAIGGDVLPAYRFFIPVLPFLYFFVQEVCCDLYERIRKQKFRMARFVYALPLVLAGFTMVFPQDYIRYSSRREAELVEKMTETGLWLKAHATQQTVVAASTIGALGYYSELPLIDMLGLTDSVIAHRPERILGVASSWRERNYNVQYVLSRQPEWICFSTGSKPSAFAERALFTREEFLRGYYPYYFHASGDAGYVEIMYKRSASPVQPVDTPGGRTVDNDFVNRFTDGINLTGKNGAQALQQFQRAAEIGPADFALLFQSIGNVYRSMHDVPHAIEYYRRAVAIDPRLIESHLMLAFEARRRDNFIEAIGHIEEATRTNPDYAPAWVMLGQTYLSMADTNRARTALERGVAVAPINSRAQELLQTVLAQKASGVKEE